MEWLWFLAGLGLGLGLMRWSTYRSNRQLKRVLHSVPIDRSPSDRSPLNQLTRLPQQLQDELHRHEQNLQNCQSILSQAPIGYLQVNGSDHLCWINIQACDLLNLTKPETIPPKRLLLEVVRSIELDQLVGQVRTHQQQQQIEWTMYQAEGSQTTPLRAHGIPLPEEHVGLFIEDRTEAKNLADERDRWTSDVAHELKTPLTSIRLMAEALENQISGQYRPQMGRLLKEVIRLSDLVKDLLELSRITFNQAQTLRLQSVNVPSLIHKAWLNLEPLAQQQNLSLFYQGLEAFTLDVDKNRLYRVFLNLLDNAIKYSPVDQPIMVQVEVISRPSSPTAANASQWLCIDIIDTGSGFPATALPHVFKRFYRSDPSRVRSNTAVGSIDTVNRDPSLAMERSPDLSVISELLSDNIQPPVPLLGGSGLGLAIAQQIVLAHNGFIQARNHPQTGGAWLQILLPCPQTP